jgi:TRAP-type C4-dicarboxylate transport system permease small subunit
MSTLINKVYQFLCLVMVACLAMMTAMVFTNTVLRYVFKASIISSEEFSRFFFVWMIFLGGIVAMADNLHIRVDLLISHLPKGPKLALDVFVNLVLTAISAILAYGGYIQASINLTNYAPATYVPLGYVYSVVMVSGIGMGLICLTRVVKAVIPASDNTNEEENKK